MSVWDGQCCVWCALIYALSPTRYSCSSARVNTEKELWKEMRSGGEREKDKSEKISLWKRERNGRQVESSRKRRRELDTVI